MGQVGEGKIKEGKDLSFFSFLLVDWSDYIFHLVKNGAFGFRSRRFKFSRIGFGLVHLALSDVRMSLIKSRSTCKTKTTMLKE